MFRTAHDRPYDLAFVQRAFKRAVKAAKLPAHFTPYCLRHTYASLLLQAGESPVYVQRQFGHASNKRTVDTYGKWLPMGNKAAVDRLDDLDDSKSVAIRGGDGANTLPDGQFSTPGPFRAPVKSTPADRPRR